MAELLINEGADVNACYEKTGDPLIHVTTESVETLEVYMVIFGNWKELFVDVMMHFVTVFIVKIAISLSTN